MLQATDGNFRKILKAHKYAIVLFGADWCFPCRALESTIYDLENEMPEVSFIHVDIRYSQLTCARYAVESVPTLVLFADQTPKRCVLGNQSKAAVIQMVEELLKCRN